MNVKRLITALVGLPIVLVLVVFGNIYVFDIVIAIISLIAMYEYAVCIKKEAKFISWVGIIAALKIGLLHIVSSETLNIITMLEIPILLFLLFLTAIVTNMRINFKDVAFSFVGIVYIVEFLVFLTKLYDLNGEISGKWLIWFIMVAAWGTDASAYVVGKNFGKHKFSQVSKNKTIEGCVGGVIGSTILALITAFIMNNYVGVNIDYIKITIVISVLSIIGQIGDFSASVIKRYFDIKDFSELFPGHGGMLDRIDSVMFIAPFAYFLLGTLL